MTSSNFTFVLIGVVPAVCDAEAGEASRLPSGASPGEIGLDCCPADPPQRKPPAVIVQDRYGFIALSGAF